MCAHEKPPLWTFFSSNKKFNHLVELQYHPRNNDNKTHWLEWSKVNNFNPVVTVSFVLGPLSLQSFEGLWLWKLIQVDISCNFNLNLPQRKVNAPFFFWSMDVTYFKSQNCHDKQRNIIQQSHDALFPNKEVVIKKKSNNLHLLVKKLIVAVWVLPYKREIPWFKENYTHVITDRMECGQRAM